MIPYHWKNTLATMKATIVVFVVLQEMCHGQDSNGGNFFYYYSPTQRTHVNMNQNFGQIFNNHYVNQPQPGLSIPTSQRPLLSFPFVEPSNQNQAQQIPTNNAYRTPAGTTFAPVANFQFPFQQQQFLPYPQVPETQTSVPASNYQTFTRFGKDLFANQAPVISSPQPYSSNQFQTQSPQSVAPARNLPDGTHSFFESPFQYIQQRYLNNIQAPTPTPVVAPTSAPIGSRNEQQVDDVAVPRRAKYSSRFHYVDSPVVNPYTRLPNNADLPYQERRYYSTVVPSAPTPTGYGFSIGSNDGNGPTTTVHVSRGPPVNSQYLTEISSRLRRPQGLTAVPRTTSSIPTLAVVSSEVQQPVNEIPAPGNLQTKDVIELSSTTTSAPLTSSPVDPPKELGGDQASGNLNTTVETLLKEPSFQTETIATLKPELSVKLSEINIPRRLVIRKKVARKRLELESSDGSGELRNVESLSPRRLSPNQLPVDTKEATNNFPNGTPVLSSTTESHQELNFVPVGLDSPPPVPVEPAVVSDPIQPQAPQVNNEHLNDNQKPEDYYEYYPSDQDQPKQDNQGDLPILEGLRQEDYPEVFKHHPDGENSVGSNQGEMITSYKDSQPSVAVFDHGVSSTEKSANVSDSHTPQLVHAADIPEEPTSSTTTESLPLSLTVASSTSPTHQQPEVEEHATEHIYPEVSSEIPPTQRSFTPLESPKEDERDHFEAADISTTTELQPHDAPVQDAQVPMPSLDSESEKPVNEESSSTSLPADDVQSSTTVSYSLAPEDTNPSSESPVTQSTTESGGVDAGNESSTVSPATPTMTKDNISTTEGEGYEPQGLDDFDSQEVHDEDHEGQEAVSSDEEIGKAQRLALQETLQRLRNKQNTQANSASNAEGTSNSTVSSDNPNSGRRRSRNFIRRPLQLTNLTLPTSGPIRNINAVLEDDEADRAQVIEKIQRYRANSRSTTTKRPRRVTRPSTDRTVQLENFDSFSDSSSVGVDPYPTSTTPSYGIATDTVTGRQVTVESSSTTEIVLPSTTQPNEFTYSPTTSTTDVPPHSNFVMIPTTEGTTYPTEATTRTTTVVPRTTLPSTTLIPVTTLSNGDDVGSHDTYETDQVGEPETVTEFNPSPSTTSTARVYITTEHLMPPTTTTTEPTQEMPAGQLIIHEILPTKPPLKEVSFVIGESVEDDLEIISSEQIPKEGVNTGGKIQDISTAKAIVRVETNVHVSSSVKRPEVIQGESGESKGVAPSGKKIRVVIKRQKSRKVNGGDQQAGGEIPSSAETLKIKNR